MVLIGDFNINLPDFDKSNRVQSFANLMFRFRMIPMINKPTHVTWHTATVIDHVFPNTIIDNIKSKTAIVNTYIPTVFLSSLLQKTK